MVLIAKIFGIGVVTIVADMLLAQAGRKDIAFGVTIVAVVLVLGIAVAEMSTLFNIVTNTFGNF